jgi:hypothetical protein
MTAALPIYTIEMLRPPATSAEVLVRFDENRICP